MHYGAWEGAQKKVEIIEIAQKSLRHVMKSQGRARRRRHAKTNKRWLMILCMNCENMITTKLDLYSIVYGLKPFSLVVMRV